MFGATWSQTLLTNSTALRLDWGFNVSGSKARAFTPTMT